MVVYLTMFILAEICAIYTNKKNRFFYLSALPFLVVASMRYYVGTDYGTYLRLQIPEVLYGIYDRVELLYRYVIKLGDAMGNYQWIFVLTHLLILFFLWKHLKEYSIDIRWSVFVFMFGAMFNISLNLMRQYIAIAICMYGMRYIYKHQMLKYVICVTIGCLFHVSVIVFLIFYFAEWIRFPKWAPFFVTLACPLLLNLLRRLLVLFTTFTGIYSSYINDSRFDLRGTQWDFVLLELCISILIFLCLSSEKKIKLNQNKSDCLSEQDFYTQGNICALMQMFTLISASASSIIPNSTRIIMMFAVGQVIYIPFVLEQHKGKKSYFYYAVLFIIVYIVLFYRIIVYRNIGETLPYFFIN